MEFLSEELPDDLATEYDRYVRKLTRAEVRKASTDVTTFALYLGKALTRFPYLDTVVTGWLVRRGCLGS